jgi:hypothetical protein
MKKGGFLNQKLGKQVTRKTGLLKSKLAVQTKLKPRPTPPNLPSQKTLSSPAKPIPAPQRHSFLANA